MRDYDKSVILQETKLYSEYHNLCVKIDMGCKCKIKKQQCLMSPATELTTPPDDPWNRTNNTA
jgi:hypothetical protein